MARYHTLQLGDAVIGGPPGSGASLMVGSIFHDAHAIVADAGTGRFDEGRAASLVDRVGELAERAGTPMAIDVVAASPQAMARYLAFVGARSRLPLMISGADSATRIAGLEAASDLGVLDRCIFAALDQGSAGAELEALHRHRPAAVVIRPGDGRDPSPETICTLLDSCFLPMLQAIGAGPPIVDLGTVDALSVDGATRAIRAVRKRFGYTPPAAPSRDRPGLAPSARGGSTCAWARRSPRAAPPGPTTCTTAASSWRHRAWPWL